jgi:hypothetical protein
MAVGWQLQAGRLAGRLLPSSSTNKQGFRAAALCQICIITLSITATAAICSYAICHLRYAQVHSISQATRQVTESQSSY